MTKEYSQICSLFSYQPLPEQFLKIIRLFFAFLLQRKDALGSRLLSYKFQCNSFNANHYGKTKRNFKVRVPELTGVSHVPVKISSLPKILLCVIICSFVITLCRLHAFLFWLKERINQFTIKSQQSLLMNRDGPQLKKTSESITLMLFSQG